VDRKQSAECCGHDDDAEADNEPAPVLTSSGFRDDQLMIDEVRSLTGHCGGV
jgi:hypothetical protein